jgi:AmmeMemoRadiSam system protein B
MTIVYASILPQSRPDAREAPRTAAAMEAISNELASYRPEIIIVVAAPKTPRGAIGVSGDAEVRDRVAAEAKKDAIPFDTPRMMEDVLAPMLRDGVESAKWLGITTARLQLRFHFEFGRVLARAVAADVKRIAIVCQAELSRTKDLRAARALDEHFRKAVEELDVKWLVNADKELRRRAGENACAPSAVLFGALGAYRLQPRILSYEAGHNDGATYLVAALDVLGARRGKKA